jgi:AcrR family transcriptional regulator
VANVTRNSDKRNSGNRKGGGGTPSRRTRLSADERRAQILESARDVFLRSGASGTRVKDLADAAGVNPALLYQHFESKEELFEEAVLRPLASAFEETALRFPDVSGPEPRGEVVREATETYIVHLLEAMEKIGALLGVVLFDDLDGGRAFFQERLEPLLAGLRDVVTAHLPAWEHADYDPDVAVMLVFGTAWYFAIENRFGSGPPRDAAQTAAQISAIIFDGLRRR